MSSQPGLREWRLTVEEKCSFAAWYLFAVSAEVLMQKETQETEFLWTYVAQK